jgi:Family of unknown function (DUF6455)
LSNIHDADRRWRNMCEMLDRLGLTAEMLADGRLANDLRVAVCTCQSCDVDQVCQDWLVRAPEWIQQAPDFCRNGELFACVRGRTWGDIGYRDIGDSK